MQPAIFRAPFRVPNENKRNTIFTCDSLAWALFKNGRTDEAKEFIAEALRTGSKDPRINYHAGLIIHHP